jgi:O-antigen ligase
VLKLILYLGLTACGIVATLVSPIAGVASCIGAYLLNPSAFELPDGGFRYQQAVTISFLVSYLLHRPRGLARVGREGYLLWGLWFFTSLAYLSGLWSEVSAKIAVDEAYEILKTVLFVSLLVFVIRNERQLSIVVWACLIGVLHASFLSVMGQRIGYIGGAVGRSGDVLPDPLQSVMVCFTPLVLVVSMLGRGLKRWVAALAIPFVLDAIVGTYERTGFVAIVVQTVLLLLFLPKRITLRLLPALVVAGGLFLFRFTPDDYWSRMATIQDPTEEASANSRFVINRASWEMLKDHPWGVGFRNYPYVAPRYLPREYLSNGLRAAHNSYFTVACELGVLGFIIWISPFIGAMLLLRRIRKSSNSKALTESDVYAIGIELGLYGWMVGGFFQAHHEVDPAYWFVGLAIVLTRVRHQQTPVTPTDDHAHEVVEREGDFSGEVAPVNG